MDGDARLFDDRSPGVEQQESSANFLSYTVGLGLAIAATIASFIVSQTDLLWPPGVPVGLVVLKSGVKTEPRVVVDELVRLIRDKIGPVASFKSGVVVKRLPKTRSGKIVRGTIKRIAEGTPYTVPATIDDPATLDEIAADLATVGYPQTPLVKA